MDMRAQGQSINALTAAPCLILRDVEAARDFFVAHFGATVTFDCGWRVNLHLSHCGAALQLLASTDPDAPAPDHRGLRVAIQVEDVDGLHLRLNANGLKSLQATANYPWGERGFAVAGPEGVTLWFYSEIPPSAAFRPCFH